MKSNIEAMRGICYATAVELDRAAHLDDQDTRKDAQALVDLMIPVVKAWCTDTGLAMTSTNIQVHGGMGFIEETGAAQHYRDARITTIYEGTNGVQAMDLLARKVVRDGGTVARQFIGRMRETAASLDVDNAALSDIGAELSQCIDTLETATSWMVETFPRDPARASGGAASYLELMGLASGGWMMARAAAVAEESRRDNDADQEFLSGKITTALYFAKAQLPKAQSLMAQIRTGDLVMALEDRQFLTARSTPCRQGSRSQPDDPG